MADFRKSRTADPHPGDSWRKRPIENSLRTLSRGYEKLKNADWLTGCHGVPRDGKIFPREAQTYYTPKDGHAFAYVDPKDVEEAKQRVRPGELARVKVYTDLRALSPGIWGRLWLLMVVGARNPGSELLAGTKW
jgi:hypothetical protein